MPVCVVHAHIFIIRRNLQKECTSDGGGSLTFPSSPLKLAEGDVQGKRLGNLLLPKVPPAAREEGKKEAAPYLKSNDRNTTFFIKMQTALQSHTF